MDIDALLENRSDDAPSGENLEYDPVFIELELAAGEKEEQQIGDEIIAAEPPDYEDVKEKALALLEKSHDLRVALHWAQAELATSGFQGFAVATTYVRRCLEEHWDTCYPELDADDDNDPTMRVNAVLPLADGDRMLRAIRRAPLTNSRTFGQFSYRDIEFASGSRAAPDGMDNIPDMNSIAAAFKDTDSEVLSEIKAALAVGRDNINAIDGVFDAQVPGQGPQLQPAKAIFSDMVKKLAELTGDAVEEETVNDADAGEANSRSPTGKSSPVGGISSPGDVINALNRITDYYARNEPSSPLPILLDRAKRLVNADFLTIVKDMAPSGVENVNLVGGINDEDSY